MKKILLSIPLLLSVLTCYSQQVISVSSPDNLVSVTVENKNELYYSVKYKSKQVVGASGLGFEFKDEPAMKGNFIITGHPVKTIHEVWKPVVKSKHAQITDHCNELHLTLREDTGLMRQMDLFVRAYNDGIAFRYKLYRSGKIGPRKITKELTTFNIPGDPKAWIVEFGGYSTSNEREFMEHPLSYLTEKSIAGMPLLMEYDNNCWVAITEADIENYCGFYIGTNGNRNQITTKLVPLPGEPEDGVKVRFEDDLLTPWRVIMIGENPGTLIESEIIQNLNDPCAIKDPSWIRPGKCAWDSWWSMDVNHGMPVIKQYIDLAAQMGWDYQLVDWKWYGKHKTPAADITLSIPEINLKEVIDYAKSKNVKIFLWLYSSDVNRNSAYKKAFPLFKEWGIAGVKIDFMDRDDQEMVNWYHDIIRCAAENHLLVIFHGAYKPDGIIRTWPNMITREGVMGNEYYVFSDRMSPEHNVKLAFTRMLAGQMDYTPGGFLNVTREEFVNHKRERPTWVWNTRAAELAKFVVYESPLTIVCDHPDHILNQPGADFLKIVPTVWDDTRFVGGYPGDYIAMARRNGDSWFLGIINNSKEKKTEIKLDFLPEGTYTMRIWADSKKSNEEPKDLLQKEQTITAGKSVTVELARNGGFVAEIFKK